MRIGLIRHFKVNYHKDFFMTSREFKKWEENYNKSDVTRNDVELLGIKWEKCYSSTLIRAIVTAHDVYKEEIIKSDLIRETIIDPIFESDFKLPYWFWGISGRFAWYFNHKSQEESKSITTYKVKKFLDILQSEAKRDGTENILVVTHGFFMYSLQKELKKRGFIGKLTISPSNGALYSYKKE